MALLYPKIAQSDAIVFGTLVYRYGPTAIMKCFMDRFVYFNCREVRKRATDTCFRLLKKGGLYVTLENIQP